MSTRWLLIVVILLAAPLTSFGADTIPCILINGKAYAPAVLLGGGTDLPHTRTMAGHEFVWVREYADAVGCELVWDGGLKLQRDGTEIAAFSTHQASQYWQCEALRTACPALSDAARRWAAPHVEPYSHEQEDLAWRGRSGAVTAPSGLMALAARSWGGGGMYGMAARGGWVDYAGGGGSWRIPMIRERFRPGSTWAGSMMMTWDEAVGSGVMSSDEAAQMQRAADELWGPR